MIGTEVFVDECFADEFVRERTDHNLIRLRQGLQASSNIRNFADDTRLFGCPFTDDVFHRVKGQDLPMNDKGRPIVSFRDRHPGSEHARFQAWRRRNPDGFFLTLLTAERARLHGARCSHLGHTEWQFDETGQSLTAQRKICATDRETLFAWASAASSHFSSCPSIFFI